jgi:hypothetical protein
MRHYRRVRYYMASIEHSLEEAWLVANGRMLPAPYKALRDYVPTRLPGRVPDLAGETLWLFGLKNVDTQTIQTHLSFAERIEAARPTDSYDETQFDAQKLQDAADRKKNS